MFRYIIQVINSLVSGTVEEERHQPEQPQIQSAILLFPGSVVLYRFSDKQHPRCKEHHRSRISSRSKRTGTRVWKRRCYTPPPSIKGHGDVHKKKIPMNSNTLSRTFVPTNSSQLSLIALYMQQ